MTSDGSDKRQFLQWDIWQVDWRHEDGTGKPRPGLLISPTGYNASNEALWFVKISGQAHNVRHRFDLDPEDPAFAPTGLTKKSYFYYANVQRVPKRRIKYLRGRLGSFAAQLLDLQIRKAIQHILPWGQQLSR